MLPVSVITTRCCWGEGGGRSQINKFKQVSSDHHQISLVREGLGLQVWCRGGGGQVHRSDVQGVPIPWCICLAHPPFPCGQTDVYENIIFPQDCLRAVKIVRAWFTSSLKAANFLFPLLLNDQGFTCASNSISLIPRITSTGKTSLNIYALTIDVAVVRIQCAFIYVWNKFYLFHY